MSAESGRAPRPPLDGKTGALSSQDEVRADKAECEHDYKCVYEGHDSESYECTKCGDRYKLYDDEMR